MMRMALIVVSLSTLTVIELVTPSRTKTNAPDTFDKLTLDVSVTPDTLEAADRIETRRWQDEAPLQPASPVEPTLPSAVPTLASGDSSTVGLRANDEKDVVRKVTPNKPQPKRTNSNKAPKIEPSKAIVEVKPCRPDALDSLLQALKLSSRCQT